ncbi:hypothetical protein MC885_017936 [Smutsia gigantea]|nr:hypothetical protein MC885_017936 [Smutsia gigantea]
MCVLNQTALESCSFHFSLKSRPFPKLKSIGESSMSVVLNQLLPMIKPVNQRTNDDYSPEELLILLIYIFSVSGDFTGDKDLDEAEEKVKKALAQVFCEEAELSPLLQKITADGQWL